MTGNQFGVSGAVRIFSTASSRAFADITAHASAAPIEVDVRKAKTGEKLVPKWKKKQHKKKKKQLGAG